MRVYSHSYWLVIFVQPIAAECWRGRGGILSRIYEKKHNISWTSCRYLWLKGTKLGGPQNKETLASKARLYYLWYCICEKTPFWELSHFNSNIEMFRNREGRQSPCSGFAAMFRTPDGTCNNFDHPSWGSAFMPFLRFLPPDYRFNYFVCMYVFCEQ